MAACCPPEQSLSKTVTKPGCRLWALSLQKHAACMLHSRLPEHQPGAAFETMSPCESEAVLGQGFLAHEDRPGAGHPCQAWHLLGHTPPPLGRRLPPSICLRSEAACSTHRLCSTSSWTFRAQTSFACLSVWTVPLPLRCKLSRLLVRPTSSLCLL